MKRLDEDSSSGSNEASDSASGRPVIELQLIDDDSEGVEPVTVASPLKKHKKKRLERQPDLTRVEDEVRAHIYDAVIAAIQPASRQPILLQIDEPDDVYSVVAYWPRNKEVGVWLLQTLWVADIYLHATLAAAIAWPHTEDVKQAFAGLFNQCIVSLDELGEFATLTDGRELRYNDDNGRARIQKSSLCAFLYTQYCRIYD